MSFEVNDIVKLSPIAKKWKNNNGCSFVSMDNLEFEKEYKIKTSITAGKDEWVDIEEGELIYPHWCFLLVEKSNSNLRQTPSTMISTGIPGVYIIK